jgi:predicted DNA-binding protein
VTMNHGTKADGTFITDEAVEAMADEAEHGYDVEELLRRRQPGRPTMGSGIATVESVRLDPELKRDLLLRAAEEGTSVSEVIRAAVRQYLHVG